MTHGFSLAGPNEWLLFWGSDDWAASSTVFAELFSQLQSYPLSLCSLDLVVANAIYVNERSEALGRSSMFRSAGMLDSRSFRRSLILGATPPHQATLFAPRSRLRLNSYSSLFRLSADLDYFLRLSQFDDLSVKCIDLQLLCMGDSGVSAQHAGRRLREVAFAYWRSFGIGWWIPFFLRYLRRLASLIR